MSISCFALLHIHWARSLYGVITYAESCEVMIWWSRYCIMCTSHRTYTGCLHSIIVMSISCFTLLYIYWARSSYGVIIYAESVEDVIRWLRYTYVLLQIVDWKCALNYCNEYLMLLTSAHTLGKFIVWIDHIRRISGRCNKIIEILHIWTSTAKRKELCTQLLQWVFHASHFCTYIGQVHSIEWWYTQNHMQLWSDDCVTSLCYCRS